MPRTPRMPRMSKAMYMRFLRALRRESRLLMSLIKTEVLPILTTEGDDKATRIGSQLHRLEEVFMKRFTNLATKEFTDLLRSIIRRVTRVYQKEGFALHHDSKRTQDLIGGMLEDNLSLIKTIPQDVINKSRTTLLRGAASFDQHSITKELTRISEVTQRRAELIARDQTAKALEGYSQAKATDLGFEFYIWQTVQDERVSTGAGGHKYLNQRIYSYSKPTAIIDDQGTVGIPSQRVNCRCTSIPLRVPHGKKLKLRKDKKRGDYYELI